MTGVEEWRPIPSSPGYEASSLGRIRSRWIVGGSHSRGRQMGSGWHVLRGWIGESGHRHVNVLGRDKNQTPGVHILVAEAFLGLRPEGCEVCHNDGDPDNSRPDNLRWDTRSENMLDRVRHGTHHNAVKTHCKRGHPYDEANTYIIPKTGSRVCRSCVNASQRAARLARQPS